MILTPTDTELKWPAVEQNFAGVPVAALKIWRDCGIMMPDEAADDLHLSMIEEFLTLTATALSLPLLEVYPARNRIRWMTWSDTASAQWPTFASLDGGAPMKITPTTKPT